MANPTKYEVASLDGEIYNKKTGKLLYLVNWKGYKPSDRTWEEQQNVKETDIYKIYKETVRWKKGESCKFNISNDKDELDATIVSAKRRLVDIRINDTNQIIKDIAYGDPLLRVCTYIFICIDCTYIFMCLTNLSTLNITVLIKYVDLFYYIFLYDVFIYKCKTNDKHSTFLCNMFVQ